MKHVAPDELLAMPLSAVTPERGNLLFVSGRSAFDEAIQAVTNSPWSHVALVYDPTLVLEAALTGVRLWTLADYLAGTDMLALCSVDGLDIEAAVRFGLEQLGDPYNAAEIADIAAHRLIIGATPDAARSWICSELVEGALHDGGIAGMQVYGSSPEDVWQLAQVNLLGRVK